MTICVHYMVQCVGGGWLDPGRPLRCLGVSTKYSTSVAAFTAARTAGWTYDVATREHRCPAHQTGDGHAHSFESPRSGSVPPERPVIQTCPCGEERERPW